MEDKLKEFEEHRKVECKKANNYLFVGIGLIAVGILGAFSGLVFLFLLAIVGIILLGVSSSMKSKIAREFKTKFVPALVKDLYPDSTYDYKCGLSQSVIMEPGFFKYPDRFYSEDYVKATYNGIPFEMSDFDLRERHVHRNSNGSTTVTYETYAKGRFMIFDFKREFNQVVKVAETKYLVLNTRGLEKV